jgi:hypothetical protein
MIPVVEDDQIEGENFLLEVFGCSQTYTFSQWKEATQFEGVIAAQIETQQLLF